MPSAKEAGLRHAAHYKDVLASADDLYRKGGEALTRGLALFDLEWDNIRTGQAYSAEFAPTDNDAAQLCSNYSAAGVYCLNLRQHPRDQIRWLQDAVNAARQLNDRQAEGKHMGNLGIAYKNFGDAHQAIEYHKQALVIDRELSAASRGEAERTAARRGEGNTLGNLGTAYLALGDVRQAIEYHKQALAVDREIGDRRGEGADLGNLGNIYYALGDARQAITFYEQALVVARDIGDKYNEGNWLGSLGTAYLVLGDARQAIEFYKQALTAIREIGDRRAEGSILGNVGAVYKYVGDARKAIEFFEQALVIAHAIGDKRNEGTWLYNMSLAWDTLDERVQAVPLAEAALKIFEEIEDPHAEQVRQTLAELHSTSPKTQSKKKRQSPGKKRGAKKRQPSRKL